MTEIPKLVAIPLRSSPRPAGCELVGRELAGASRREMLALGVSLLAIGADVAKAQTAPEPDVTPKRPPVPRPAAPKPLPPPKPPVPVHRIALRAERITARLSGSDTPESTLFRLSPGDAGGGNQATATTFPVLRGKEGEPFALDIENALDQHVAFHLRGIRGVNSEDGMPGLTGAAIPPGGKGTLIVDAKQSGTFILAPSLPETAPEQAARGLSAALVVEEKTVTAFDHDLVLAASDWRLDEKGALAEDFLARQDAARIGRLGNRLVANGALAPLPLTVRPGARIRVRMINVSTARLIPLRFEGVGASVYAIDSTPCQPFDPLKRTVALAPSSRIEMVVDAPGEAGKAGMIEAKVANGLPILALKTEGAPLPPRAKAPPFPDPGLPPAIRLQEAVRAECTITGGVGTDPAEADPARLVQRFPDAARIYSINSVPGGFSGKPLATMKRGRVFVLALHNKTAWPQVIAVHGHAFRLLHAFDDGWEPYFLDTLYMPAGTTARIALIAENPGKWAIRSTIPAHFAAGVATWFEVT